MRIDLQPFFFLFFFFFFSSAGLIPVCKIAQQRCFFSITEFANFSNQMLSNKSYMVPHSQKAKYCVFSHNKLVNFCLRPSNWIPCAPAEEEEGRSSSKHFFCPGEVEVEEKKFEGKQQQHEESFLPSLSLCFGHLEIQGPRS